MAGTTGDPVQDMVSGMGELKDAMKNLVETMQAQKRTETPDSPNLTNWASRHLMGNAGGGRLAQAGRSLFQASRAQSGKSAGFSGGAMKAGGSALLVVAAATESFKRLVVETDNLVQAKRQYAQASASMALVMAQRDVRELVRSRDKGEALSGSARELTQGEQKRKDSTKHIEVLAEGVTNKVLGGLNELAANLLEPLNDVAKWARKRLDIEEPAEKPLLASELLKDSEDKHKQAIARNEQWFIRKE